MKNDKKRLYSINNLIVPFSVIIILYFIYYLEISLELNFNSYGILPRDFIGLRGVLFSHFIHSNATHLLSNTVPLLVLLTFLISFYKEVAWKVLLFGGLLAGFLTWIIGRYSYHIGASGIIYLLFSFIFFSGLIKRQYQLIAISLIVIFLYGSMIWFVLPIEESISWEGHLSGFVVGFILSFYYRNKGLVKEDFQFSQTAFDEMFGNTTIPLRTKMSL